MKALVIYHGNCNDGFGAAWAFHHLKEKEYTEGVIYHAAVYGKECNAPIDGDTDVWILDFSYPLEDLKKFAEVARRVSVLDHHKTALERYKKETKSLSEFTIDENLSVYFDMSRSGAMIAWDTFNTSKLFTPSLINHIQDRDLWKFELVETKAYTAALRSYPQTFKVWDDLAEDHGYNNNDCYLQFILEGEAILRYFNQQLTFALADTKREITIDGVKGLSANLPPMFASDAGSILAEESGTFGLTYFINQNGHYSCSLRSIGDFDVSSIAKKFGGGGHKNAAGFSIREISYMNEIFSPHHIANSVFEEMKKE